MSSYNNVGKTWTTNVTKFTKQDGQDHTQMLAEKLERDGSVPWTGNQDAGSNALTGLASLEVGGDTITDFTATQMLYQADDTGSVEVDLQTWLDGKANDVKSFGAVGDGVTDDTAAIQAAVDAGLAYLPPGTYIASTLTIPTDSGIIGHGLSSILKQKASTSGDFITVTAPTTTVRVRLQNFTIDGNKANQSAANDGVNLEHLGSSGLIPRHRIRDLWIYNCKGTGFRLGFATRESVVDGVNCYACDVNGIEIDGADSQWSNCIAGQSGDDGIRIEGSACMLVNLKSWFSGRLTAGSAGFLFRNAENIIGRNLYSQENSGHGFTLFGQSGALHGCDLQGIADSDNTAASTYSGVNVDNVTGASLRFMVTVFSGSAGTPYNGMVISDDSVGNTIDLISLDHSNRALTGAGMGANQVRVNGDDLHFIKFLDDFDGDVIADQWNGRVGTHGSCVTPTINVQANGAVRLTTGADAAGTMAANGCQLERTVIWAANQYGLSATFRVKLSAITDVAVFLGFTDQASALEMPFTLGAADALTSNASDAVGVLFDTGADTDDWWLVGVAGDSDATHEDTAVAPVAGTFETWRVNLDNSGNASFYRNGAMIGSAMTSAVTAATLLTPVVAAFSRGAASRNVDLDFVGVQQIRN